MNEEEAFKAVFKEVFGTETDMNLEQAEKVLSYGISLPKPRKSVTGEIVYSMYEVDKYISEKEFRTIKSEGTIGNPTPINSLKDLEKVYKEIDTFLGNMAINSKNLTNSDQVLGSTNVYHSYDILSSKFIGFSSMLHSCEYMYGSKSSSDSSFCIRCQDSKMLNNCYEVSWSAKCSNSMFCHNSFDLRECMFCFHLASKQYCIGNRQYTKEEYMKVKKMVIEHLLKNNFKIKFFPTL
jgi:hypothetical protein